MKKSTKNLKFYNFRKICILHGQVFTKKGTNSMRIDRLQNMKYETNKTTAEATHWSCQLLIAYYIVSIPDLKP